MAIFKAICALAVVVAQPAFASTSVRGTKEEVVLKYGRQVDTNDVLDALEEAGATFKKQLECTRGMIVEVDAKGRRVLESKTDLLQVKTNPHRATNVPDFMKHRELQTCECNIDNGYVLTNGDVSKLKAMVRANLVSIPDYDVPGKVCPTSDPNCNCPFAFADGRRHPNTCVDAPAPVGDEVSNSWPDAGNRNVPLVFAEVGMNSFDGSLADSAGALVRNAFHDCGTFDKRGNVMLSGCNGCVDLTSDKNNGLQNANAFLKGIQSDALLFNPPIKVTMADLIILASTVAIEETIRRFNYVQNHDTLYDPSSGPDDIVPLGDFIQYLNIPFKYGRMDIPYDGESCPCEETDLPTPEAILIPGTPWSREEIRRTMGDKYDFSMPELAALMGVHSLGKLETQFSGYKGQWNFGAPDQFSNAFFAQSRSGRRLVRQVFTTRELTLNDGTKKTAELVTEWRRGGGPNNPFIFLNSDITFLYDLSYKDGNGNLCNVTEFARDGTGAIQPESKWDIVCPQFSDQAAQDYERYGGGLAEYKEWLGAFSKIYRRMTDELVPCANPLQEPRGQPQDFNIAPGRDPNPGLSRSGGVGRGRAK
jgi:hypothetical protein